MSKLVDNRTAVVFRKSPPPMMNLYSHRKSRKGPEFYSLNPYVEKGLARLVDSEIKEEEGYKDMEFYLTTGNDRHEKQLSQLAFRLQRLKEISECHSAVSQSVFSQMFLTLVLPWIMFFLVFVAMVQVETSTNTVRI